VCFCFAALFYFADCLLESTLIFSHFRMKFAQESGQEEEVYQQLLDMNAQL
jgi:hypothetical protein